MEDDNLARVISVEKEIQACLEAERIKASEWLERVKRESEEEFARTETRVREDLIKSGDLAKKEAVARAEKVVRDAEDRARVLLALSDEALMRIILGRLYVILP